MSPLRCESIHCRRSTANAFKQVLIEDFSASFESGDITGFCGSDVGAKELLLSVLGLIEPPDSGRVFLFDEEALAMSSPASRKVRDTSYGYLFTHPHLLPSFTVAENVAMPFFRICGQEGAQESTLAALEFVGIPELNAIPVGELPDSVHWRVAFARAIVHSPPVLIAVSPPNPLLLPLARRLADECGTTVLWNGDKSDVLPFSDQVVEMTLLSEHARIP
jgi:putative ABC transport system ATP-binding protein